ncbi:40S ribosomal protein S2 [Heterocephalus glaber]|uniref:Small ribosomal subunit protein uS5 n=1 Tax=Heterocephalus glaber TaxID=10181 RepID=G5BZ05_HETGA|nr:40S ribosomal protein S2 [Heterocephalus glaber]
MKIKSLEEIYLFSLPIKESEIIDFFPGTSLMDEVLKIMPVQEQTRAGQWTRFKPFVTIRDYKGLIGLGVKHSKEACGSVLVCLTPAPKKLLLMAGINDCYTPARGCTATLDNFAKATFDAISKTYSYLTPWTSGKRLFTKFPCQEVTDHLVKTHTRISVQRTQAPAAATI